MYVIYADGLITKFLFGDRWFIYCINEHGRHPSVDKWTYPKGLTECLWLVPGTITE